MCFLYLNLSEQMALSVPVAFWLTSGFTHFGAMIDKLSKTLDYK